MEPTKTFRIKLAIEFDIETSDYYDPGWVEDQCGSKWVEQFLMPTLEKEDEQGICNCARYEYLSVVETTPQKEDNPESDEHE